MFLDVTKFPLAKMYDEHTFEETPGVKITNTITVKVLGFFWRKIVAQKIVLDSLPDDMQKQIKAAQNYETERQYI